MSTEDNKAITRRLYEAALNTGNLAVVDELVASTVVLHYDYPADSPGPANPRLVWKRSNTSSPMCAPPFLTTISPWSFRSPKEIWW
jgi:hypothetical protein